MFVHNFGRFRWLSEPTNEGESGGGSGGGAGKDEKKEGAPGPDDKKAGPEQQTVVNGHVYLLQDHANALIGAARTEGKASGKTEAEQKAKDEKLKEEGEFKKLYDAEVLKSAKAADDLKIANLATLRLKLGAKHGLSETLSARLIGDDETTIEADAKAIAKETGAKPGASDDKKKKAPPSDLDDAKSGTGDEGKETPDKKEAPVKPFRFQTAQDVKRSWNTD